MAKQKTSRDTAANAWSDDRGVSSGFGISIADVLDGIKDYFSDVLSDDVLNELGATRVESEFSENLKYCKNVRAWHNSFQHLEFKSIIPRL